MTNFDYLVEVMILKCFDELRILAQKLSSSTNFDNIYKVDEVDNFHYIDYFNEVVQVVEDMVLESNHPL